MNYKNFRKFLIIVAIGLVFPVLILAELDNPLPGMASEKPAEAKTNIFGKNFCENTAEGSSKIEQKIADLEARLAEKRAQSANKISQLQSDRDKKLAEKRAQWDTKRNELYAKMGSKAFGSKQKQAVAAFKTEVEQAVLARRAAIDNAINIFRSSSNQIFVDRKIASDQAILNYKIAVQEALGKAQSDCQKVDAKTARKNLADSLKAAKENFNIEKQGIEKTKTSIQDIQNIKKEAMGKAIVDFKSALEKAKEGLKQSFPETDQ